MYKSSNNSWVLVVFYSVAVLMGSLVAPVYVRIVIESDGYMPATAFQEFAVSFGLVMLVVTVTFAVVFAVDNRFAIVGWLLTRFRNSERP